MLVYGDAVILHALQLVLQTYELVVVGGEKCLAAQLLGVADVLRNCTGNAYAVKGGGSPAHLVKDNKTVLGGVFQYIRDFAHLHHEGGLSCGKVVRGAHTGEYLIHHGYLGGIRRHEAAYLRHEDNESRLTHICGFTRHIGTRDDGHTVSLVVYVKVVWHKHLIGEHELHDGVSACLYVDSAVNGDIGLDVLITQGNVRKGTENVHRGNCRGCALNSFQLGGEEVAYLRKDIRLQRESLVLGAENGVFSVFQLLGDEALGVGEGLLAYPALGDKVIVGACHLQIVAEHAVEAYFQILYACGFLLALLYLVDDAPAVVHYVAKLVKLLVEALLDDTAVLDGDRRLVHDGILHKVHQLVKGGDLAVVLGKEL